jgi:demethylmenaquinone methyltransferase/2-methoxy-6-polyprenyl-1,4-benzoquinol methylase
VILFNLITAALTVTPYHHSDKSKKEEVEMMFNNIAPKYDLLNHLLSFGIDKGWRKKAIRILEKEKHSIILDVATGTADFAIAAQSLNPQRIEGIDIAEKMLSEGRIKIKEKNLDQLINLTQADSENMPFADNTFDAITVGFGVRNFENLEQGLREMYRVLKPGGNSLVLEFSIPEHIIIRRFYFFYFSFILPFIGRLISKDSQAYSYLPESVKAFPSGKKFLELYKKAGFAETRQVALTFGIASIYIGKK